MNNPANTKVLCVPNLQGEHHNIQTIQQDWVSIQRTLVDQCDAIDDVYSDHVGMLGTSFGGLAVWKTISCNPTLSIEFVILIDVLPSLELFPRWKISVLRMIQWLPTVLTQKIYSVNRLFHGYRTPVNFNDIVQRIHSLQEHFPKPTFPFPTLILSKNSNFHKEWERMAMIDANITALLLDNPNKQIEQWVQLVRKPV